MKQTYFAIANSVLLVGLIILANLQESTAHKKKLTEWVKMADALAVGCEGEYVDINCPNYEGIRIVSAFWGRDDVVTCQPDNPLEPKSYKDMCKPVAKDYAFRKVKHMCQGIESCKIPATTLFFDTEMCPNVLKYLRIKYECRHMTGMKKSLIEKMRSRK